MTTTPGAVCVIVHPQRNGITVQGAGGDRRIDGDFREGPTHVRRSQIPCFRLKAPARHACVLLARARMRMRACVLLARARVTIKTRNKQCK